MVLAVGCLQLFLDRGQTEDWFASRFICLMAITSFISFGFFIHRGLTQPHPIINLRLFKDYNFTLSCVLVILFAIGVFSVIALQPIMLQQLMNYTAKTPVS